MRRAPTQIDCDPLAAQPLDLDMVTAVQEALSTLGRTEDLRFSPNNRRLVLAGYLANSCLLLNVQVMIGNGRPRLRITAATNLESDDLSEPHGFDFVDDQTMIVGNRTGSICCFDLPETNGTSQSVTARHRITRINWMRRIHSPGSVLVTTVDSDGYELLVCNNYRKRVTRHRVRPDGRITGGIALQNELDVPDGITQSPDRRWLAISNHFSNAVLIFDQSQPLTPRTGSVGKLIGIGYPHGLRFTPDGRYAFVADAGAPLIHVFHAADGDWSGARSPIHSHRVLSGSVFQQGRTNDAEGGPKGLDIDATGTVLVMTCETQPLAAFAIADLI